MKKVFSVKILLFFAVSASLFLSGFLNNCKQGSISSDFPEKITIMLSSVSLGDPHICSDSSNRLSIIWIKERWFRTK